MAAASYPISLKAEGETAHLPAILFDEIASVHLKQHGARWKPLLGPWKSVDGDGDWIWSDLLKQARSSTANSWSFAIEADDQLQGLMIAQDGYEANLSDGEPLLYISYLATAPWNRREFDRASAGNGAAPRAVNGVGLAFVYRAMALSVDLGYGGRVGLHSLDPALSFYVRSCHFTFIGKDAKVQDGEYPWCELPDVSARYLQGKPRRRAAALTGGA